MYRLLRKGSNKKPCWAWRGKEVVAVYLSANINYCKWSTRGRRVESCVVSRWKSFGANGSDSKEQLIEGSIQVKKNKKKGTITGAVALIIGTSIGSGILALPKKTAPAVSTIYSNACIPSEEKKKKEEKKNLLFFNTMHARTKCF